VAASAFLAINVSPCVVKLALASNIAIRATLQRARSAIEPRSRWSTGIPHPNDDRWPRRPVAPVDNQAYKLWQVRDPFPAVVPRRFGGDRIRAKIADPKLSNPWHQHTAFDIGFGGGTGRVSNEQKRSVIASPVEPYFDPYEARSVILC